jgi:hypothetical protein
MMGHPPGQRLQYGRVHGAEDDTTWKYYYNEDPEAKRQRKKFSQVTIDEKVARAIEAIREAVAAYRNDMAAAFTSLISTVVSWVQQNQTRHQLIFPCPASLGATQ